jgi:hypothetical protein
MNTITLTERELTLLIQAVEAAKRAEVKHVADGTGFLVDVEELSALRNKLRDA